MLKKHLPPDWRTIELRDMTHRQVAELMKTSAFLINVNTLEAFNTTVPEAMAAGCVPVCYEAYGGQDFLKDGDNAFVFPNNYVYPLAERVIDLVNRFNPHDAGRRAMQKAGSATANRFTELHTKSALLKVFGALLDREKPGG
jgi:glycosyltransferase involved in cell wall biosynthesis